MKHENSEKRQETTEAQEEEQEATQAILWNASNKKRIKKKGCHVQEKTKKQEEMKEWKQEWRERRKKATFK